MKDIATVDASQEDMAADDVNQYLTFVLGGENYGVSILVIKEILEYHEPTTVPMMPDFIRGVINLRGSVVPVVDLSLRLGKAGTEVAKRTCVVIIEIQHEDERMEIGVVVDAVNEVLDIPPENIEAAPNFGAKIRTDFINGMGKVDEKFVVLLNIDHVLSIEELSMVGEVAAPSTL
ncbi:MAG: chemotaxis protein CheW [Gammaproteobacteria bacterium]|nr:chemotaxis protein CheW [Gammaproteobacteria bacterium]